jgi:hypothetical protein
MNFSRINSSANTFNNSQNFNNTINSSASGSTNNSTVVDQFQFHSRSSQGHYQNSSNALSNNSIQNIIHPQNSYPMASQMYAQTNLNSNVHSNSGLDFVSNNQNLNCTSNQIFTQSKNNSEKSNF